jgi:two-component system LytT family response regulator
MSFKTLIIDDEELARQRMRKLLEVHSDQIEIVGEATNGIEAIEKIRQLKPDLIFLDIQMPGMTGFDVLEKLEPEETPLIVFATAFDEFALRAFEENSVDFLLKPVEPLRLKASIEKLNRMSQKTNSGLYESLRQFLDRSRNKYLQRLQVRIGDRIILVHIADVVHFESQDKYTTVHTAEHQYIIDTPLVELEKSLDPNEFIRIHRAHLVRITNIIEIQRSFGGKLKVILNDPAATELGVSRNYTERVRSL